MRLRTKILFSHILLAAAACLISGLMILILQITESNQKELLTSYEQIRVVNLIAAEANEHFEQIAELYILGPAVEDITDSRADLAAALDRREELLLKRRPEAKTVEDRGSIDAKLGQVSEIRGLLEEVDEASEDLLQAMIEGRYQDASGIYAEQIERRLDRQIDDVVDMAMEVESNEVDEALVHTARLSDRLRALSYTLIGTVVFLGVAISFALHREIVRPVRALAEGTEAVGRGDLGHSVTLRGTDEFAELATRFNLMTAQVRDQRNQLLDATHRLEEQVTARTVELKAAVDKLKARDESRARFLADTSHELRTPLTILLGQSEIALRGGDEDPDNLRTTLQTVVRKAGQMARMIDDLLFLARSESGAIPVKLVPLIVQDVLADALLDSPALSQLSDVTILPRQPAEPLQIMGDPDRLRQAILIPLENAVRLAPAKSAVLIELHRGDGMVCIEITDHGPGFAKEEKERMFQRFYRGAAKTPPRGRGTGLGLSIARWIVEQHHGTISIGNLHEGGASVRISLPIREETP